MQTTSTAAAEGVEGRLVRRGSEDGQAIKATLAIKGRLATEAREVQTVAEATKGRMAVRAIRARKDHRAIRAREGLRAKTETANETATETAGKRLPLLVRRVLRRHRRPTSPR